MRLLEADYINHKGQKLFFGSEDGLFLNEHDLFNFNWNVQTRGNRIISVDRKGIKEHTLPLVIVASSRDRACELANELFSVCEEDLMANKKGRLVVNDYNLSCFIRGQDYSEWSDPSKCLKISAHVIRDSIWYKELDPIYFNEETPVQLGSIEIANNDSLSLAADAGDDWTGGEKGYAFGYPYDYPNTDYEYSFVNKEKVPLSWKAYIYGPAGGPSSTISFTIAGHVYAVNNVSLGLDDHLEITAKEALDEKTVIKFNADGTTENCFAHRSTTSYLFEPIPTGTSRITFASGLEWALVPIVERSAPVWL